jgi:DNA-binding IclR family transcriptional regulator
MSAPKSEPVRPIRALLRGLAAMAALRDGAALTVTDVARRARLPRTTAYRVLETLRQGGHVDRDAQDRYHLTALGAALDAGQPRAAVNGRGHGAANGAEAA